MSEFNLDWLLGPRDWCVVDDCVTSGLHHDNIYAVINSRRCSSDLVLAHRLRKRAARRLADKIRRELRQ